MIEIMHVMVDCKPIFDHIGKAPVEGNFPPKPEDIMTLFKALQNGLIPVSEENIEMFAMNDVQGYEYVRKCNLRQMTPEETALWKEFQDERREEQRERRSMNKASKKEEEALKAKEEILLKMKTALCNMVPGKKILCFDTETTGVKEDDEILQLTIMDLQDGEPNALYSEYFKPRFHDSWDDAMKVNHISPQMLQDKPYITSESKNFLHYFEEADVIVGYNVSFDIRMLKQCLGNEVEIPEEKVFDVMAYFKESVPEGKHKLIDAVNFYCPENMPWFTKYAHDALADTGATLYVLKEQIKENLPVKEEPSNVVTEEKQDNAKEELDQIEIFYYIHERKSGDQCWYDAYKYFYCPETDKITQLYKDGWALETKTYTVSKDDFFETVSEIREKGGRRDYSIYTDVVDEMFNGIDNEESEIDKDDLER